MAAESSHPMPPYGVAIHQAIATGDLARMWSVATSASAYLSENGDLRAALEVLKAEIARAEAKKS